MDRFTNGELDALLFAINQIFVINKTSLHRIDVETTASLAHAKAKLEAQRKAQD